MTDRHVKVTLTADVSEYLAAMKKARKATKKLGRKIIHHNGRTWRLTTVLESKNRLAFKYEEISADPHDFD